MTVCRAEMYFPLVQIEDMCHRTRASAVPVVPDSEGYTSCHSWYINLLGVLCW